MIRAIKRAWWCFELSDLDSWIKECHAAGIGDTHHMRACYARCEELRVKIALLEAS